MAMLGMAPEDDDGNSATDRNQEDTIGPGQMKKLEDLLGQTNTDKTTFLAIFGVDVLADLTVSQFVPAVNMLEKKKAKA